jgi:hypothetical protein
LEDDQFVGRLNYYKMSTTPDKVYGGTIGSNYQQQGLALSKQFKREDQYISGTAPNVPLQEEPNSKTASRERITISEVTDLEDDDDSILSLAFPSSPGERRINAKTDED